MDGTLSGALAVAVRMKRAGLRLSQEALAGELGVSRGSVADLETGRRRLGVDELEALCRALDASLPELLGLTERGREAAEALGVAGPQPSA